MKISKFRYEQLLDCESRLEVLQNLIDDDYTEEPDIEAMLCVLGLDRVKRRQKKAKKDRELQEYINSARKGGTQNGDTV